MVPYGFKRFVSVGLFASLVGMPIAANAQLTPEKMAACNKIKSESKRLACFEQASGVSAKPKSDSPSDSQPGPFDFAQAVEICAGILTVFKDKKADAQDISSDSEPNNIIVMWPPMGEKKTAQCAVDRATREMVYVALGDMRIPAKIWAANQAAIDRDVARMKKMKSGDNTEFVQSAKDAVTRDFKDPGSAQWRGLFLAKSALPTLCGEVNAKNSYGAYTGFKKFFTTGEPLLTGIEGSMDVFATMYPKMCAEVGTEIQ